MKRTITILLIAIMALSLAACGRQPVETPQDPDKDQDIIIDPKPEGEKVEVTLYYMNEEYIATGDESLEKAIAVKREVLVGEKPLEEVVLAELQKQPQEEGITTSLEEIKVLSVETAENTAYVNLAGDKLHGGSLQETSILTQMILSLTELEGIEQVQIYVDGSVRETLMSHYFIQEPLTRKDIGY
ncbi:GerMN domain-containing protein [Alkaliphilus crotonatoxidans]